MLTAVDPWTSIAVTFDQKENTLLVYPTTTTGRLQLSLARPFGSEGELRVFSLTGQLLLRHILPAGFREQSLDVSSLPVGSYFLQLQDREETLVGRFVKHGA